MPDERMRAEPHRRPLDTEAARGITERHPFWREVLVVGSTGSTNDDVADAARSGAEQGLVVVAEEQAGGRGRLDRQWVSPRCAGLTLSALLRPTAPADRWPWLPLLAGVAAARAVRAVSGLPASLKWPNDVLVSDRKLGGLLAEVVDGAVVVGIGLNVTTTRDELPRPDATSLALEGGVPDRDALLGSLLGELADGYAVWDAAGGDPAALRHSYLDLSATVGSDVAVSLPGDRVVRGRAVDVDAHGRLVVDVAGRSTAVSAGDVQHVRPA